MRNVAVVLLATLALLAVSPVATAADDPTVNITSAEDSTSDLGVDAPASVADIYDSPYESVTIRTTIVDNSSERDVREPVIDALSYWENNSVEHAGYPVNYTLVEQEPDLKITLTDDVSVCGSSVGDYYGCADVIKNRTYGMVDARVEATLSNPQLYEASVHEIGHTLGLGHDDAPQYYMDTPANSPPKRTPTHVYFERGVPTDDVLSGLEYVRDSVDNVIGEFETVSNPEDAGLVVKTVEDGACGEDYISCTQPNETLSDQWVISVEDGLDDDAVPWHVAYLISSVGERPEILQDASYEERRSEWWM